MIESVGKRLFISNFPWATTENDLRDLFGGMGELLEVRIMIDRETQKSRGFGFVEYANATDAAKALKLNGQDFNGRDLTVTPARPREKR
jgi:RNA recognition motif-containing protein